ncbi:MAG TPA: tRNA-dihydrouridine synthase [Candidatus Woesebacteria bacterium]|nr:tRNA-dihydrouridine synthase [Candidatus Woesebacteria bacterium]
MQQSSFWHQLNKPTVGLSPMDGVSDHPFRVITKKYGNPDVIFTEFVSVEGLCHSAAVLLDHFIYNEQQRPVVAQIFGKTPEFFRQAAILVSQLGFDGIDINMGCPARTVTNHGSGAGLIQTPELAQQIVRAVQKGVQDYQSGQTVADCADFSPEIRSIVELRSKQLPKQYQNCQRNIPISIKTRLGYSDSIITEWLEVLFQTNPELITVHGRTLKQGYGGQANWEDIGQAANIAKKYATASGKKRTLIFGNGDVQSRAQAEILANKHNLDGVLIGRASFGNPFVFLADEETDQPKLARIALEHAQVFEKTFAHRSNYNFLPMRKHLGWYIRSLPKAKEIRLELVKTNSAAEVEKVLTQYQLI